MCRMAAARTENNIETIDKLMTITRSAKMRNKVAENQWNNCLMPVVETKPNLLDENA